MSAVIRTGSSGFSYKEWLGTFYPPKLPGVAMLSYYAQQLPTVEINYTFRAMPRQSMLEGWAAKTSTTFRFALKAPQRITHFSRLKNTGDSLDYFVKTANVLGERLGPVLFQLPPDFKCDVELLGSFLDEINGRVKAAFEFRNRSWFNDRVLETLRTAGAALCIAESEKLSSPIEATAPHAYVRLRKETYDDRALNDWAEKLRDLAERTDEIYVYFKHEVAAPGLAARLAELLRPPA